eukprot:c12226_g1_i1.p1 GENE.c12226_g1_i1~~c12226_g1_i1.p1  ORF type:complete len:440 (+),score=116.47 c12226_g1_i1:132-1451(+)
MASKTVRVVHADHPLVAHLPSLFKYAPSPFIPREFGQTIYASLRDHAPLPTLTREIVQASDGANPSEAKHLLVLVPGVTGNIDSVYIRFMCRDAFAAGWEVVVLTFRGLFGRPVTSPKITCGADREDLLQLLQHIVDKSTHPSCVRVVAGVSMGANMLVNFLGTPENAQLYNKFLGAVSFSNPFDFPTASQRLHSSVLGRKISANITTSLRNILISNRAVLSSLVPELADTPTSDATTTDTTTNATPNTTTSDAANPSSGSRARVSVPRSQDEETFPPDLMYMPTDPALLPTRQLPQATPERVNIPLALKARSVAEFDHAFTARSLGYSSLFHYYHSASSTFALPFVPPSFPLLVLTARDDSFVSYFPFAEAEANAGVIVADCDYGGHVGFIESLSRSASSWAERMVLEFAHAVCIVNKVPLPEPRENVVVVVVAQKHK